LGIGENIFAPSAFNGQEDFIMKDTRETSQYQYQIYRIRGQQVMLGPDVAVLYGVPTKALMQAIRRNLFRFPPDFMFQLTASEMNHLRSQIVTSSWGGHRYAAMAFTEHGLAMLSSVLRSRKAVEVNIAIIRAFIKLRHALLAHQAIARRVETLEGKVNLHDTDIRLLIQDVDTLKKKPGPGGPIQPGIIE
jgi:hypothetical protein